MERDLHRDEVEALSPALPAVRGRGRARRLATPAEAAASPTERPRLQTPVHPPGAATPPPARAGRGRGAPKGGVQRPPTPETVAAVRTVTDHTPESTHGPDAKDDERSFPQGAEENAAKLCPYCVDKGDLGTLATKGKPLCTMHFVETAIKDPDSMDAEQLKWLACSVVKAAANRIANAEPAAFFCQIIVSNERDPRFFHCLLDCCLEWYTHRYDWLPRQVLEDGDDYYCIPSRDQWDQWGTTFKWRAFVGFLAELMVAVVGGGRGLARAAPASTALIPVHFLAWLLCNCLKAMLRFPAADMRAEMQCFTFVLKRAGNVACQLAESHVGLMLEHVREAHGLFPKEVEPVLRKMLHVWRSKTTQLSLDE